MRIDGDLVPANSGISHLGINGGDLGFNISTLTPFGQIHQVSGVFHDPILGQSGILRYNRETPAFEVSVDGGLTFQQIQTGAPGGITSIGVLGGTDLAGNVDLASSSSGFLSITSSAGSSPLLFGVDHLALSGLWGFPSQGFNDSVVNSLLDSNGTQAGGDLTIVGASGLLVDIVGQTVTISPANNALARCVEDSFTSVRSHTVNHGFGTTAVIVQVKDSNDNLIIPDNVSIDDANNVTVSFNSVRSGAVTVMGC